MTTDELIRDFLEGVADGPARGCGCSPVCRWWEGGSLRIWAECLMDEAQQLLADLDKESDRIPNLKPLKGLD